MALWNLLLNFWNQSSRVDILTSTPSDSDGSGPFITLRNTNLAHLMVSLTYKEQN